MLKRVLELLLQGAIVVAFVVCVEVFLRRRRPRKRIRELPVSTTPPARLRVRHGSDRARVVFGIEGTLDEFSARMLACCVAQLRHSTTAIVDLSEAGPISGRAIPIFEGILAAGRRIQVRGLRGYEHDRNEPVIRLWDETNRERYVARQQARGWETA